MISHSAHGQIIDVYDLAYSLLLLGVVAQHPLDVATPQPPPVTFAAKSLSVIDDIGQADFTSAATHISTRQSYSSRDVTAIYNDLQGHSRSPGIDSCAI